MSGAAEQLDLLRFPLSGSRLIEASAGSGKTFTIALLYVRLVLGHGREEQITPALMPPEILVVTFTEAATQELRDRIRARLSEAAEVFLADPDTVTERPPGEDLLHDLRAEYPSDEWSAKARQLQWAAEWMDESAVSTIHAWCNRMLREHAFDSGSLFTQTLETDQSELLAEAVRDYWRTFFAPLPRETADTVRGWWLTPEALQQTLKPLLEHPDLLEAVGEPRETVALRARERTERLAALKAPWTRWLPELQQLLDTAVARKQVDGRKLQARYYQPWLDVLAAWVADAGIEKPNLSTNAWQRLTPQGLGEAWKQGEPPGHPALAALAALTDERIDFRRGPACAGLEDGDRDGAERRGHQHAGHVERDRRAADEPELRGIADRGDAARDRQHHERHHDHLQRAEQEQLARRAPPAADVAPVLHEQHLSEDHAENERGEEEQGLCARVGARHR